MTRSRQSRPDSDRTNGAGLVALLLFTGILATIAYWIFGGY